MPYAFTEQGVAMLSSVLNSDKAININIQIMRTFVQLRNYAIGQNNSKQIDELCKLLMLYIEKNDRRVNDIIGLVREPGWFPHKSCIFRTKVLKKCCFYMEVVQKLKFPNNSIIALNNLISQPVQTKQIGFRNSNN